MGVVTLCPEQAESMAMRWLAHWVSCQEYSRSTKADSSARKCSYGMMEHISNDSTLAAGQFPAKGH